MFSRVEEPDVVAALLSKYEKEWQAATVVM
jgi:hypothetical protein